MQENKNVVQEALLQMKNVEEAIAENAKGILASTMKEEINQLVKESLSEQDEEEVNLDAEIETDPETDFETDDEGDVEMEVDKMKGKSDDDDDDFEMDFEVDTGMNPEESPIDLRNASDEKILKIFKAMGEEDGIIVVKDGEDLHLTDNQADTEYLVKMGESTKKQLTMEDDQQTIDDIMAQIFQPTDSKEENLDMEMGENDVVYEIEFDEELDEEVEEDYDYVDEELDEEVEEDYNEMEEDDVDSDIDPMSDDLGESYNPKKSKKGIKPKGVGIGHGPKFSYEKSSGGFDEDMKEGPKKVGTGKAKFVYKKGENMGGKSKVVKKAETKEAARTLGMGSNFREGGLPKPRAHSKFNSAIKKESLEAEVKMLREKNEEYRKALNVFREKLTEVAIFNSNLAYATRLFTEHSTTKKEKINILRRFDNVESLKESKGLYKVIKDELSKVDSKPVMESVETKLNKTVSTGSSTTLIESKTYENPQFLRMKDLMSKIK